MALGLLALCSLIAEGAAANWSGLYLQDNLGAQRGIPAAGFAAFSLAMAAGRLAGDRLAARYGPAGTVRRCALLASAGLASALLSHDSLGAVIGFAVSGAGFSCVIPQLFSAAGRVDSDCPGGGIARVAGVGYLGLVGGPALIGACASLAGLPAALGMAAVLGLCVAAFAQVLDRPLRAAVPGSAERILPHRPDHDLADVHRGGLADGVHHGPGDVGGSQLRVGLTLPGRPARRRSAPGWIRVTRTPVPTHSARMLAASALTAHLVAEYRLPGRVTRPATEPVSSRWPPDRVSAGSTARAVSAAPSTFVATSPCHSPGGRPSRPRNEVGADQPALANTTSSRPSVPSTSPTRASS